MCVFGGGGVKGWGALSPHAETNDKSFRCCASGVNSLCRDSSDVSLVLRVCVYVCGGGGDEVGPGVHHT